MIKLKYEKITKFYEMWKQRKNKIPEVVNKDKFH